MNREVLYLGLDVHAETIALALAEAGRDGEVRNSLQEESAIRPSHESCGGRDRQHRVLPAGRLHGANARLGKAEGIVATAHNLARVLYAMIVSVGCQRIMCSPRAGIPAAATRLLPSSKTSRQDLRDTPAVQSR